MALNVPQEIKDDEQMAKSVMDEPRTLAQKVMDLAFGRTMGEKFTSAMTSLSPMALWRGSGSGVVSPPFKWLYGDIEDIPKFNYPKQFSGVINPEARLAGIGIPEERFLRAPLPVYHQDLWAEIRRATGQDIPSGSYGHTRLLAKGAYAPNTGEYPMLQMAAPYKDVGNPIRNLAIEERAMKDIMGLMQEMGLLKKDSPLNIIEHLYWKNMYQ